MNRRTYSSESPYEVVAQHYLLVVDPQKSATISENIKKFAADHNINSILYVPLNVGEEITHFMTFDALDQRQRYGQEEIEIFLFLGREIMKAQRMERLDDILHDFKNPAIALRSETLSESRTITGSAMLSSWSGIAGHAMPGPVYM